MIKSKGSESSVGQTVDVTKENGKMANRMVKALTKTKKDYRKVECGWMAKRSNGTIDSIF
jgi:hypothetical protein